jgi:hypothetical protein
MVPFDALNGAREERPDLRVCSVVCAFAPPLEGLPRSSCSSVGGVVTKLGDKAIGLSPSPACPEPTSTSMRTVERSEASLLLAFDTHRAAIHAVAITTYKRERKGSYELSPRTFRRGIEAD